ncbi:MAG: GH92 family glycosyl hydrolase, partial [bacterium]|nr:GH92 family glycosyl hydrolase [Candidatus Colisoma equi]
MMKGLFAVCLLSVETLMAGADPARYVDPFVGCADNGHCFAAAAYPMGMVQAGPDTGNTWWDYCSGYRFADTNIIGFSQTHLSGTGCGDLGDVRVMPVKRGLGSLEGLESLGGLAYAKSEEVAEPGYYAVTLKDAAVRVEIAAAKHAAIYRFKSLDADLPRLLVDLQYGILNWSDKTGTDRVISCEVRKEGDCRIVGSKRKKMWVERVYHFVLYFNRPIAAWENLPKRDERERGRRVVLDFGGKDEGPLMMKFGISANSVAAAKANLSAEVPGWDLAAVRTATREAWNRILSRVEIEGTDEQKRTFYTSLYHLYIQPNDIADVGAEPYYSTFSTWDTFRAAHPLYTILSPEYVDGFVNSMLKDWRKHGYLPIWTLWGEDNQCMIGTHSVPIIVDWFLKSGGGPLRTTGPTVAVDWQEAYATVKDTLTRKHVGRSFEPWDMLERHGYIPFDKVGSESVSRTLEFAYDDWCAARFAETLGKKEDAAFFDRRAFAWTNVFDRTTCLMRGRDSSGKWRDPFNPFKLNVGGNGEGARDFTEGNAWQYS